jgi:hypothetical protein
MNDNECPGGFCAMDTMTCVSAIVPKYLPDICDTTATSAELQIVADTTLNTADDGVCNGGIVTQSGGPDICVVRYGTISVAAAAAVSVTGARPLALVADQMLSVDGILDVSAVGRASGPGGGLTISGGTPAFTAGTGGGGAGFQTVGAPGGTVAANGGAANGGVASTPQLLQGGPRAAGLMAGGRNVGGGGGGGGATLIACRGAVSVSGLVDAGGGSGTIGVSNGDPMNPADAGGGGGGAGGYVVLQGRAISVTGQFYANGGGGGSGIPGGANGSDGDRSTNRAPGGVNANGGSGGAGGAVNLSALPGLRAPVATPSSGGGGGGGVGYFETCTPAGVSPMVNPTTTSPAFSPNGTIPTK